MILCSDKAIFTVNDTYSKQENCEFRDMTHNTLKTVKNSETVMVWCIFSYCRKGKLVFLEKRECLDDCKTAISTKQCILQHQSVNVLRNGYMTVIDYIRDRSVNNPNLNQIENIWAIMKELRERDTSSLTKIKESLTSDDLLHKLADSIPKRLQDCGGVG